MVDGYWPEGTRGSHGRAELKAEGGAPRRLHIVHVVRCGFAGGGMENGIINVTNRLPPTKFRVSIVALDSSQTFSEHIHHADFRSYLLPKRGKGIDWRLIWRLRRQLKKIGADVVHSHNWSTFVYAVVAAKLAGVPNLHGEHGKNPNEVNGDPRLKSLTKRTLGRGVQRLIAVSRQIAAEWAALGIPETRIRRIPNGVNVERFRPRTDAAEQRQRFGLPTDGILIGSVGRLDALKNYSVAIEALKLMRPVAQGSARLALLGEGVERGHLAAQARELGIADRIFFLGRRSDPEDFLSALDIFVLPSKTEGMSNVVLEAMASGLPVVCADLPAHREVFEPGVEGLLVSPCTPENLATVFDELAADPERKRQLGASARAKAVSQLSVERMVSNYERLYDEFGSQVGTPGN